MTKLSGHRMRLCKKLTQSVNLKRCESIFDGQPMRVGNWVPPALGEGDARNASYLAKNVATLNKEKLSCSE